MESIRRKGLSSIRLYSLLVVVATTLSPQATAAEPSLTDHSSCGCFLSNDTEASYFSGHSFFDFRNLGEYARVPPVIDDADEAAGAEVTSEYFKTTEWTNMWWISSWNNGQGKRKDATVYMVNSPNNIYIEDAKGSNLGSPSTWLTLRTQRNDDFQSAAELETVDPGFQYLSVRMLARTIGAPGAITALFTYRGSEDWYGVQESDIEVRTSDPRHKIQYTNQPSYTEDGEEEIPEATRNATLPGRATWSDWAVHRLDWTPGQTRWFVNGLEAASIAFQTPRDPCKLLLNVWSDGGSWAGNMSVGAAAYMQIQWLEVLYNRTSAEEVSGAPEKRGLLFGRQQDQGAAPRCNRVCSVDETPNQGQPVMLWDNGAVPSRIAGAGLVGLVPAVVMFVLAVGML